MKDKNSLTIKNLYLENFGIRHYMLVFLGIRHFMVVFSCGDIS